LAVKKSAVVRVTLLLAAASACTERRCVDTAGRVVDDTLCEATDGYHRWWYGHSYYGGYFRGGSGWGGGSSETSGVSRGGFGATGAAHGIGS
jgi:hypothetical protein